jgi:hypothetical protein
MSHPADYQQHAQNQPQYGGYQGPPPKTGNGFGVAALVLGIIATVIAFIPVIGVAAFLLGIVAIILGVVGLTKKGRPRGTSIAGLVLGVISLIIAGIVTAMTAAFVGAVDQSVQELDEGLNTVHTVEYRATVDSGEATAAYGTTNGISNADFTGDWSGEAELEGFDAASLTVTGDLMAGGDQALTCEISVDGQVVAEQSGTDMISCSASTMD